ncbi:MAG TPA: aminotransferase class III-fold pyridoxal phosphate-dependent enzyme, partial [bacterium]|nr:aminotransferase class III-fold pyridoxal phosphate-dependent enzyme [bacterium]
LIPCVEMVRYSSTGSEAVAAALRLARAFTGRTTVVRFAGHYHGWFDELLLATHPVGEGTGRPGLESAGQSPSSAQHVLVAPWNDLAALEGMLRQHDVAVVLMEPIMCNTGVIMPARGYLEGVRTLCARAGTLLIFDEVITGFRVHLGGAQGLLGVTPDLAVFGKALANGYPISVLGGRREIMALIASGAVVHSGTFNGNPLGTAAALATLDVLGRDSGAAFRRLTQLGQLLMQGIRRVAASHEVSVLLQGPGPVFYLWFTDAPAITSYTDSARVSREPYARFAEAMLREGVRVIPGGRWYVSLAHTEEDIERTCEAVDRALARIRPVELEPHTQPSGGSR